MRECFPKSFGTVYKKLRSSIVGNNPIFNTNLNYNEFKPIPTRKKTTKKTRKKAKSLHENTLNICIKYLLTKIAEI